MSIDPIYAKKLGFEHIEIKPNAESGLSTMNKQIRNGMTIPNQFARLLTMRMAISRMN